MWAVGQAGFANLTEGLKGTSGEERRIILEAGSSSASPVGSSLNLCLHSVAGDHAACAGYQVSVSLCHCIPGSTAPVSNEGVGGSKGKAQGVYKWLFQQNGML